MKISELARRTRVPLATIKYYLREGLLMPGTATGATTASYGDQHVRRIRVVKALTELAGLPIRKTKTILGLIENPGEDLFITLGRAISALPPYLAPDENPDYPLARKALERVGQIYDPKFPAVAQLDHALRAVAEAGIPMSDERLGCYAEHLMAIAQFDLERMPVATTDADASAPDAPAGADAGTGVAADAGTAVEYAVLGTALYEPVVVAMRRLAHQSAAARLLDETPPAHAAP